MLIIFTAAMFVLLSGCTPPGPRALLRGDELLREDKAKEAITELKQATDLMPGEPRAWNLLGLAYHRAGQAPLAVQAYRQALARDRSNVVSVAHYNLGCLLFEQNNVAAAADELRSFTLVTNSVAGLVKLGAAQSRLRQWDAAEHTFRAALQLEPRNPEALNGVGVIHAQRSQRDAAQYFKDAAQANPKYAPALLNSALLAQQNPATKPMALQRFREYLAVHASSPQSDAVKLLVRQLETELTVAPSPQTNAVAAWVNTLKTNQIAATNSRSSLANAKSNALAAVTKTNQIAALTNLPPAHSNLPVTIVSVANQPTVRVASAEPLVSDTKPTLPPPSPAVTTPEVRSPSPDVSPPLLTNGAEEDKKKRGFFSRLNPFGSKPKPTTNTTVRAPLIPVEAQPSTTMTASAISVRPVFPRYTYTSPAPPASGNRAGAIRAAQEAEKALHAGDTNKALLDYQHAIAADPSYFDAQYYAALLVFQGGDAQGALAGWEKALALEPESMNARYSFALALKQANYAYDAANELEKIIEAKPKDASAHLALGNLYAQQLNDREKARAHYVKALELQPRSPQASAIRFWLAANP